MPDHPGPESRTRGAPGWSALARDHPGLVVSAGYFAATMIGMMSSWTVYQRFGIDIFHHAQFSDFALAAVRNPWASLAVLLAIPAVWLIVKSDDWLFRRFRIYPALYGGRRFRALSRTPPALLLYLVLYGWVFSLVYAGWFAESARSGGLPEVEVQLLSGTYQGVDATRPFVVDLLGTTSAWVFLYDDGGGTTTAVPIENVVSISPR